MSLRLRRLRLDVKTDGGNYGCSIPFGDGLVVLRAENTSGKSTCMKAIIYALGLERVFGPGTAPPLPPAMRTLLEDGERELRVVESSVWIEIENQDGRRLTIRRWVVSEGRDWRLITTFDGPALSNPKDSYNSRDFYVRDPGSATREDGFHSFLASFIGWELPTVTKFNGDEVPLYLECILPLFYAEQMNGWSRLQATTPRFFQIRNVEKRAVEFLLKLDVTKAEFERQRLVLDEEVVERDWAAARREILALAEGEAAVVQNLPREPVPEWPPEIAPTIAVPAGELWVSITDAIAADRRSLLDLEQSAIPLAAQVTQEASAAVRETMNEIARTESFVDQISGLVEIDSSELDSIDTRLSALSEDLTKNQDVARLKEYGSPPPAVSSGVCPTCHQAVADSLLPQGVGRAPMAIEDNIEFIKAQKHTFEKMRGNVQRVLEAKSRQRDAAMAQLEELRGRLQSLRQTLNEDGRQPSIDAVRQRVVIGERIGRREGLQERFLSRMADFRNLSEAWDRLVARRNALRHAGYSNADRAKLGKLERLLVEQETDYGFTSFPPNLLKIALDDYHPTRDGFDLVYDVSASDNVRTIVAYLVALLEVGRGQPDWTNHPGILILDEPRQQSLRLSSFRAVFARACTAKSFGQQIIIATSESAENIRQILSELPVPAEYHNFQSNLLTRLD